MTTTKTKTKRRRGAPAAAATPPEPVRQPTTLAVPVGVPELVWLAGRLREVSRGWPEVPPVTLVVRREAVTGLLWGGQGIGVVASVDTAELVPAVDDLPAAGLVVMVDLPALLRGVGALRGLTRATVAVDTACGAPGAGDRLTLRHDRGTVDLTLRAGDPVAPPLSSEGVTAGLDAAGLARALGEAARLADPSQPIGEQVTLDVRHGALALVAGTGHRGARLTLGAVQATGEADAGLSAVECKAAAAVLAKATGEATVQVTAGLVTLTGRTRHGTLGVMLRRRALDDYASKLAGLYRELDQRSPALLLQVDAGDLGAALKRGRALGAQGGTLAALVTVDAGGSPVWGHAFLAPTPKLPHPVKDGEPPKPAKAPPVDPDLFVWRHVERLDGWATGRGEVALDPRLLPRLPKAGPLLVECGGPLDAVRVRVVDGALSIDTLVMPLRLEPGFRARVLGEPEAAPAEDRRVA